MKYIHLISNGDNHDNSHQKQRFVPGTFRQALVETSQGRIFKQPTYNSMENLL